MTNVKIALILTAPILAIITIAERFGMEGLFVAFVFAGLFSAIRAAFQESSMQVVVTPDKEILVHEDTEIACPKCQYTDGGDWSQCKGSCPLDISPHFAHKKYDLQEDIRNLHRLASCWFNNDEILMLERVLKRVRP